MTLNIQSPLVRPPVPKMPIQGMENPLSKALRKCDNKTLTTADTGGVYISTNETGIAAAHKVLVSTPKACNGCGIGFSGWHNFDIVATRQSSLAIICDKNPENAFFYQNILGIVKTNANNLDFIEHAAKYVETVDRSPRVIDNMRAMKAGSMKFIDLTYSVEFQPNVSDDPISQNVFSPQEQVRTELKKEVSWLRSPESYRWIRKLALEDKIVLITEDICNTSTFEKIRKILQDNSIQIDSLYVSNIPYYMDTEEKRASFLKTIDALSENDTLIISSDTKLIQKVGQPKAILDKKTWFFGVDQAQVQQVRKTSSQAVRCTQLAQLCAIVVTALVVVQLVSRNLFGI